MTGDIDVTTPAQSELEEELRKLGFVRPSGPSKSTRGWVHPDLGLGFEVVAEVPMDGNVPAAQLVLVAPVECEPELTILSIEDMIVDRMGQYASGTAPDMLAQAQRSTDFPLGSTATILSVAFARKVLAIMASKTSEPDVENWPGRRIDMAEYGRTLADHIAKNGPIPVPRNTGKRRTASKKALLEAIDAITEKQGWRW